MTTAELAGVASAAAAAASALFAGVQIRLTRLDVRRRAAFDYIRIVGEHLAAYNDVATIADPDDVLAFHERRRHDLTPGARAYLRLLGELDLAAYGIHKSLLDRKVALGHLKTLLRTDVVELSLLRRLQTCLGDECIYEDLARLLNEMSRELRSGERTPPPSTHNQTLDAARTPPGTAAPAIAASTPASIPAAAPPSGAHR